MFRSTLSIAQAVIRASYSLCITWTIIITSTHIRTLIMCSTVKITCTCIFVAPTISSAVYSTPIRTLSICRTVNTTH